MSWITGTYTANMAQLVTPHPFSIFNTSDFLLIGSEKNSADLMINCNLSYKNTTLIGKKLLLIPNILMAERRMAA